MRKINTCYNDKCERVGFKATKLERDYAQPIKQKPSDDQIEDDDQDMGLLTLWLPLGVVSAEF